jgi:hypothetical protein
MASLHLMDPNQNGAVSQSQARRTMSAIPLKNKSNSAS